MSAIFARRPERRERRRDLAIRFERAMWEVPLPFRAPDLRSPARFLLWVARGQRRTVATGALFGILWMGAQAGMPAVLGTAIEAIDRQQRGTLLADCGVLLGLGILQAAAGVLRHRRAVLNFLIAACRVDLLIADHAAVSGADLARHVAAGEIANLGANDVERIGQTLDTTARFSGAVVSYLAVAVVLLVQDPMLGLVLVVGAPVTALVVGPLMRPLERRNSAERDRRAEASSLAADTVVGLRILRGLGGEATFLARFVAASQRLRTASVRSAVFQSNLDALQILLPGLLLVVVTFLGALAALHGRINPGQLVAYYAYTAFLVIPMRTVTEMATNYAAATVAAGRVIEVLRREPLIADTPAPGAHSVGGDLVDELTGFTARSGQLTVVAARDPAEAAALADRLGRYADPPGDRPTRLGGVPLTDLPLATVRERVLVVETEPVMLAGTLRELLAPAGDTDETSGAGDAAALRALDLAAARDVLDSQPEGLATELPERARTLSGGQRQRVVLAQALLRDPEILVLVEPTSAVDAHTESAIAANLRRARAGRTTVVCSTSPLVLEHADQVVLLDVTVLAEGTHAQLLDGDDRYRLLITRGLAS
jgi:ABC-type multidrug transport system fused ATPase/permease subunit